ncbi:hypothetical protein FB567DRAFT_191053 [Paraphoma chrysanthemicola]|uniref:Uncharacterized protein n=1 Tax=Paraphoma chrysanthemicola TaxID=798071 RepID=A0A8K0QWA4_9PLEO|nr:hypothetical protein FB567DRAFT_191053 [Paraphoma chrysanthemicola]
MILKPQAVLLVLFYTETQALSTDISNTDRRGYFRCPLPKCSTCPSHGQLTQSGVGFALEMGYGTVAIRWHNGTIQHVARVEGSQPYLDLMKDLSLTTPTTRFPDDIPATHDRVQYVMNALQRMVNKFVGFPANKQTRIIGEMLQKLKVLVEQASPSGQRVTHAVVTSPDSMRLTAEEISDVLDYLRIKNLMQEPDELYSTSAAYAGYNHGLCKSYTNPYVCDKEQAFDLPLERVLAVDFSDDALRITIKGMKSCTDMGADAALIDSELGFAKGSSEDDMGILFMKIRAQVREYVGRYRPRITVIILTGTRVGEERFRQMLREGLAGLVDREVLVEALAVGDDTELDHVFATARGAAEIAKRRLEGPVRCTWRNDCPSLQTVDLKKLEPGSVEL